MTHEWKEGVMIQPIEIQETYLRAATDFWDCESMRNLRSGRLSKDDLYDFISSVFRTHFNSPHILAFLFSSLPSQMSGLLRDNLLEELGLTSGGPAHPALLVDMAKGAGFTEIEVSKLVSEAQDQIRQFCSTPSPFPTLRDLILSVLLETEAFEFLLSRYAASIGAALHERYGLTRQAVRWFDLHAEADIRHAEEGIRVITDFLAFYRIGKDEFEKIRRATFQTNVFHTRYFPKALSTTRTPELDRIPV
jgi:pyrroloquinoline quinone (PQQ) biosynthesis protein C